MSYVLGLDIGTTGAKALLVDDEGKVVASATSEYPTSTPKPLWNIILKIGGGRHSMLFHQEEHNVACIQKQDRISSPMV